MNYYLQPNIKNLLEYPLSEDLLKYVIRLAERVELQKDDLKLILSVVGKAFS